MKVKVREADKDGIKANIGEVRNVGELNLLKMEIMKKGDTVVRVINATTVARLATLLETAYTSEHKEMLLPLREKTMIVKRLQ
ncbi:hypothetical protein COLO4_34852 [Corchorus olitorius]|uniref:Uncharacterized protein n=1 Tax=Corchorus olitorius TaxID=93759 RepID=A0A1R3GJA2_9ROSI|nr:hypothetical protein COLO4_34852 [Corchorus olitorius]